MAAEILQVRVFPQAFSDMVGVAQETGRFGVIGTNSVSGAFGFLAGNDLAFTQHAGVYGESDQQGVVGIGTTASSTGVFGSCFNEGGFGIRGETTTGVAVQGTSVGAGLAGKFVGNVDVTGTMTAQNISSPQNISCFDIILSGGDCAEDFDIARSEAVEPGTVMVMDTDGTLCPCDKCYDKKVTGVISGAGDYKPGIILDKRQSAIVRLPLALLGKVYCKVDAEFGSIEVGDLLTTSSTFGHAMKASDTSRAFGAVIGKALKPIAAGQGLIPILVALQ